MSSSSYLLKSAARCMVPHIADEEHHGFLVATANLRGPNEVRLLRYYEEEDEIECTAIYRHAHDVTSMSACPTDMSLLLTVQNNAGSLQANVWSMPDVPVGDVDRTTYAAGGLDAESATGAAKDLSLVSAVSSGTASASPRALCAQWLPPGSSSTALPSSAGASGAAAAAGGSAAASTAGSVGPGTGIGDFVTVDDSAVRTWALTPDGRVQPVADYSTGEASFIGGICSDALHPAELAVAVDASVQCWDLRSGSLIRTVAAVPAGGPLVRSVSYNVNKPMHLATGGDDMRVKVWDLRRPDMPVKILEGHTHWVSSVAFNAFHDQLLLSAGTDARVNLWRISSVSAAPLLELWDDEEGPGPATSSASAAASTAPGAAGGSDSAAAPAAAGHRKEPKLAPDVLVRSHVDHDDSVTAAAWSVHSAWVYATLSASGRFVVAQVPSAEKYKILL